MQFPHALQLVVWYSQALKLCEMLEASDDWESDLDDIVDRFQQQCKRRPLYTICFY